MLEGLTSQLTSINQPRDLHESSSHVLSPSSSSLTQLSLSTHTSHQSLTSKQVIQSLMPMMSELSVMDKPVVDAVAVDVSSYLSASLNRLSVSPILLSILSCCILCIALPRLLLFMQFMFHHFELDQAAPNSMPMNLHSFSKLSASQQHNQWFEPFKS